jgi:hypothetical protein
MAQDENEDTLMEHNIQMYLIHPSYRKHKIYLHELEENRWVF